MDYNANPYYMCIDRDNDLGEKAGVSSPIIGHAANLDAANKLASIDPEDSDINTIFGGINVYDKLIAENIDIEIISIAGDKKVGVISDKKISEHLDKILPLPSRCCYLFSFLSNYATRLLANLGALVITFWL